MNYVTLVKKYISFWSQKIHTSNTKSSDLVTSHLILPPQWASGSCIDLSKGVSFILYINWFAIVLILLYPPQ